MSRLYFYMFAIWFLILPLSVLSSIYLGITAIDKLMAPLLIALWLVLLLFGNSRIDPKKISFILLAFSFFLIRNISKIDDSSLFISLLWEDAILFGYFCLPILYIDDISKLKTASKLISINAIVGCVSAFLVAIGLLTLPYERFSQSRFDLGVLKSIGLFSAYGDLAQYSAFFLLLAVFIPENLKFRNRNSSGKLIAMLAFALVIMGLIGNQSRSFLLSLITALFMAIVFHYRSKETANKMLFNTLLFAIGISVMAIAAVTISQITAFLGSLGGGGAAGTAMARFEQYQYAFRLINENPIFGVNGAYYAKFGASINGIHDMWLSQMARGGIVSGLLLFWLLFMMLRSSLRLLNNPHSRSYGVVTIGYMFAVLVSTLFYPSDTSLSWALLGMNVAILTTARLAGTHHGYK